MNGYWGVVPAAGRGKRFGAAMPKQYIRVAGSSVLEHSLGVLLRYGRIRKVLVSLADGDDFWSQVRYSEDSRISCCRGGDSRAASVMRALEVLHSLAKADDWVVVHDAVRPCLKDRELSGFIKNVEGSDVGGLLVSPVNDALKRLREGGFPPVIECSLERKRVMRALTPQMFRFGLLFKALRDALDNGVDVDDEAQAMELAGHRVQVFEGQEYNVKLTHPCELPLVKSWLELNRPETQS